MPKKGKRIKAEKEAGSTAIFKRLKKQTFSHRIEYQ